MTSSTDWFDNYNELLVKYNEKWILIVNNQVILANESFDKVYLEYEKVKDQENSEMVFIDDGARFYAITNTCQED